MASIVVGCGGSGIKTILRLNQMMAENVDRRHELNQNMFYLAIDTESAILGKFRDQIAGQMRGATLPCIQTIHLSKGITILSEVVHPFMERPFVGNANEEGRARLMEQWWHRESNPFRAPLVRDITMGAGQCPPVSTLLAWWRMPEIEKSIKTIFEEIKLRQTGTGGNPLAGINIVVVSGLAGGTGRGCWPLVTFKLRQMLAEQSVQASPVAVLFDAGVFDSVCKKYPEQETFIKVNSLTGISELSCWMANRLNAAEQGDAYKFRLPSLSTPQNPKTDVLNVSLELNRGHSAPVDNAYLICGSSQVAVLANNDQYHEMVGTGLYALLTTSDIKARQVNESASYMSMAAAAFEVDVTKVRLYFENQARRAAVDQLTSPVGDVGVHLAKFFESCPVLMNLTADDRSAFMPDEKGPLLQKACHFLVTSSQIQSDLQQLDKALEADDPQQVLEIEENLIVENPVAVQQAVKLAVGALKKDPAKYIPDMLNEIYKESRSIESVRLFIERLLSRMVESFGAMPSSMEMDEKTDPRKLAVSMAQKDWPWGPRYNKGERAELKQKTPLGFLAINYPLLKEELKKECSVWMDMLARQSKALQAIMSTLNGIRAKFENESIEASGGKPGEDAYSLLFADPDKPETSIPAERDPVRFYKRVLKPAMTRTEVGTLTNGQFKVRPDMQSFLMKAVKSCGDNSAESLMVKLDTDGGRVAFRKELESAVRDNVYLPEEFLMENFSFMKVIQTVKKAWEKRLNELRGDADRKAKLVQKLETFFGVRPVRDRMEEKDVLPELDEMLKQMAASLACLCKPWWQVEGRNDYQTVTVFVPKELDSINRFEEEVQEKTKATSINVFDAKTAGVRYNPYAIVAFASQSISISSQDTGDTRHELDKVTSLNYYKDVQVNKWLQMSENVNGQSIFNNEDQNKGVGYTSPIFIKNEYLRDLRWKPWWEKPVVDVVENQETMDALLYSFLPMSQDPSVARTLTDIGWSLPLIKDAGSEKYVFVRKALEFDGSKADEDNDCPWKANETICTSIWQVVQYLSGQGKKGVDGAKGEKLKKAGTLWRKRILQEAAVFTETVAPLAGCNAGTNAGNAMVKAREKFFADLKENAEEDDAAVWDALIKLSKGKRTSKK